MLGLLSAISTGWTVAPRGSQSVIHKGHVLPLVDMEAQEHRVLLPVKAKRENSSSSQILEHYKNIIRMTSLEQNV